jgi:Skp family chaperone for outer membrane proteins
MTGNFWIRDLPYLQRFPQERHMNSDFLKLLALTVLFALLLAGSPVSFAANDAGNKTTGKDVGKKIDETAQAIKNYSAGQRDEALKNAKSLLDDADERIDRLESDMSRNWGKMNASARKHAQETMRTLRRQRQDLSQSYGELKRSSASAWDEVRNGFSKSYDALRDSFSKAAKEF